jgi:hypothetical protein
MKQQTFSDIECSNLKRQTKRDEFLKIMDEISPGGMGCDNQAVLLRQCCRARGIESML